MVFTANPKAIAQRRERVETLYGRGFSERAIAESLKVSQGSISKDLKFIREQNAKWYDENSDPKGRRRAMYWGLAKQFRDLLQEQWVLFSQVPETQLGLRNGVLGNISRTLSAYADRVGIVTPTIDQAWLEDQVRELNIAKEELRQKVKILPLA